MPSRQPRSIFREALPSPEGIVQFCQPLVQRSLWLFVTTLFAFNVQSVVSLAGSVFIHCVLILCPLYGEVFEKAY